MLLWRKHEMPTRNVNLTEHFDRFVEGKIRAGRYGSASEIMREGLRLLEQRDEEEQIKLEWLRNAAEEGFDQLDRGDGLEFRSMKTLGQHIDQLGREASDNRRSKRNRA
jgi:antitoxin ParD1/3/4